MNTKSKRIYGANPTMIICQWLVRANYLMKISVHQFINNVNIIEVLLLRRSYDISKSNNLRKGMKNKK